LALRKTKETQEAKEVIGRNGGKRSEVQAGHSGINEVPE
jgi:hypothetical protein